MDIVPLHEWLDMKEQPLVISGPCSAESEDQIMVTARALARIPQVRIFRAGIWKPRTRPMSFEGVGTAGLEWLRRAGQETGLLTAVEVANPSHVEEALRYEVDILWIGARTVVNPFSLQELANGLKGVDVPVMVKNPVNPDLHLWLGALERINMAGIRKIIAIHRGFYFFRKSPYRNAPMWEIPIELMRLVPQLPLICDPSHISGEPGLLGPVSQKALDLEMDGLMIESHHDPEHALTDRFQQITPAALRELLASLVVRSEKGSPAFEDILDELRSEIDKLDGELIQILFRRMSIVDEIGRYKKDHNVTILQLERWSRIFEERLKMGRDAGLEEQFLHRIIGIIHDESIRRQTEILNKPAEENGLNNQKES
ncbi:MAG: bifunctional 3-deoxy-7-phosphoheptulonate synthase/chorismate mutase type II [Bacteroidales bacterium]|nr:bifunctional 3-deoxy-7-phosphoheptulonate synthase/chorismate mutase type II [Bacteroidales bacterium]